MAGPEESATQQDGTSAGAAGPVPPADPAMDAAGAAPLDPTAAGSLPDMMQGAVPHDLSPWALFLQADTVVKAVIVLLVLASIACWAIIIDKMVRVQRAKREVARFEAAVKAESLAAGRAAEDGMSSTLIAAGLGESRDGADPRETRNDFRRRIERAMRSAGALELRALEPGLPFLATIGSVAPFVGLFGTVWGIMNSFTAIAGSQDTSLAVVAPGIAEALFATALGLVAAIPAVVAYNKISAALGNLGQRLGAAASDAARQLARNPARPVALGGGVAAQ